MVRKCVICGRQLKTGRKYCYEHRNNGELSSSIKRLENAYFKHRLKEKVGIVGAILFSMGNLIVGICAFLLIFCFMAMAFGNLDYAKFYTILGIGGFIWIVMLYFGRKLKKEVRKEIIYRSKEFVEYAKAYGELVREEREFRKSIFS